MRRVREGRERVEEVMRALRDGESGEGSAGRVKEEMVDDLKTKAVEQREVMMRRQRSKWRAIEREVGSLS